MVKVETSSAAMSFENSHKKAQYEASPNLTSLVCIPKLRKGAVAPLANPVRPHPLILPPSMVSHSLCACVRVNIDQNNKLYFLLQPA